VTLTQVDVDRITLDRASGSVVTVSGMRVLVTGGAGFIGSHYVRTMLSGGYPGFEDAEVTVFDKLTYAGNLANLAPVADNPRYRFVQGDICVPADLDAALPGHDAVVHFAAESHVDRSITGGASAFVLTNVLGTQQLFDAVVRAGIGRVVHVSTDEVYGSIDEGSWTEEHLLEPNSPYSASKAGSDLIARAYAKTYGVDVSITRCSNNYGPYHYPEKVIPLFVTNLLDGLKVPLYGEGANVRDWLFVDDHCRGIQLVLEKGQQGEVYNIGGGRELSNRELTEKLLEATGRDWSYVDHIVDPRGGGHDLRYSVDHSKTGALGYVPRMGFEEGLALTVQWYRDNRSWWEPLKAATATTRA
jgi:dTDP-glucose 4,6-dehydratase